MLSNSCETMPMNEPAHMMNAAQDLAAGLLGRDLVFPAGLLGLPDCQNFTLSHFDAGDGKVSPFLHLQCKDQELSFLAIHPDLIARDYGLPLSSELLECLGAESEQQILPLLIVTVREHTKQITVNLQGPLVIAIDSGIGAQLVIEDYPVRYPLAVK